MEGIIYCLRNDDLFYIGSTKNDLAQRLIEHEYDAKRKHSISSKQIIKQGNYEIYLIEKCDLGNLKKREGENIKEFKRLYGSMCVNQIIAGRDWRQRRFDEPEKYQAQVKLYQGTHQEQIQKYRDEHKIEKTEYNKKYVAQHPELLEKNRKYQH